MPDAYGRARRWATIALLALAFVPASAQAASRDGQLRRELRREWRAARPASGAFVWDATHRRPCSRARSLTLRPIGSNAQLFTGAAALRELGAATTLPTEVLATTPVDATGTLPGDLFLRGSGDPTLDRPQIEALVDQITAAGVRKVTGSVVGDGTRFDAVRTGPTGDGVFDPQLGGVLGALVYQRGRQADGGEFQRDPDRAAAFRLDDALEARGVVIVGIPHAGATPAGAVAMAAVSSPPVAELVTSVVRDSDNYVAEMLTKAIGARAAVPARRWPARRPSRRWPAGRARRLRSWTARARRTRSRRAARDRRRAAPDAALAAARRCARRRRPSGHAGGPSQRAAGRGALPGQGRVAARRRARPPCRAGAGRAAGEHWCSRCW
jgi:D-alanyl-D-alanine carboxypeptidase/D-alanyl-D-alanine-endopeptidase (penicillin-binding protein 4)